MDASSRRARYTRIAGSMSPERVPMTMPSTGVRPMLVSTTRPPRMAAMLQPLPRWQVTIRDASDATPRSASMPRAIPATYWCDVPWKPYRRTPRVL